MNSDSGDEFGTFFLQAEDGIRYYKVTGVQTCALPIYGYLKRSARDIRGIDAGAPKCARSENSEAAGAGAQVEHAPRRPAQPGPQAIAEKLSDVEIGRASCRERGWMQDVDVRGKAKKIE